MEKNTPPQQGGRAGRLSKNVTNSTIILIKQNHTLKARDASAARPQAAPAGKNLSCRFILRTPRL